MYKVRRRLINFRVSDEELALLKDAAARQGSRCLSDFARATMFRSIGASSPLASNQSVESRLESLDDRLNVLEANMSRLSGELKLTNSRQERLIGATI
jgi:hypothetical protein